MLEERRLPRPRRERRRTRSEFKELALNHQLRHCAERSRASTMVLADKDGLLVSSARGAETDVELAARLPTLTAGSDAASWMNALPGGDKVIVSGFCAAGTDLFLCAVGDQFAEMEREIALARSGVRRILH